MAAHLHHVKADLRLSLQIHDHLGQAPSPRPLVHLADEVGPHNRQRNQNAEKLPSGLERKTSEAALNAALQAL